MNILIPHKWLLEHLETEATPEDIQRVVSLSGPSIERIYDREFDQVYDVEITTNRVDSMSIRGFARECAVILERAGYPAKLKNPTSLMAKKNELKINNELPIPNFFNDIKLNKRVMFVILKDVARHPTPLWMARKLRQVDLNVHEAIIDITNYVTHEFGHPCHAFDYDKVMKTGGKIYLKEAKKNEKIVTLDGEEFTTLGGEVVFKNQRSKIIDLPSIKGTANTSIGDKTKNVLLLMESIDAKKVRFASMSHGIRTTAAQLTEKNVDPNLAKDVMLRAIKLYYDICFAEVASKIYDDFPGKFKPEKVVTPFKTIYNYLGVEINRAHIEDMLVTLGCKVKLDDKNVTVYPPTFRPDLQIPVDIVEEVARIYGYHNLPSTLMEISDPIIPQPGTDFGLESQIKHHLSSMGWQEVYTYSMVSEAIALGSGLPLEKHLKIQNPLTDDRVYLRRSLIPSLIEILENNPQHTDLEVFEIANTYQQRQRKQPIESMRLSLVSRQDYRSVRGVVENLLAEFFVPEIKILQLNTPTTTMYEAEAEIWTKDLNGKDLAIGQIGVLDNGRIGVDIELAALLKVIRPNPTYQPIPKTMPIIEDLTFEIPEQTRIGNVIDTIMDVDPRIKVEYIGQYNQNHSFRIIYHDQTENMATGDIEPLRTRIVDTVGQLGGKLVGSVG